MSQNWRLITVRNPPSNRQDEFATIGSFSFFRTYGLDGKLWPRITITAKLEVDSGDDDWRPAIWPGEFKEATFNLHASFRRNHRHGWESCSVPMSLMGEAIELMNEARQAVGEKQQVAQKARQEWLESFKKGKS